MARRTLDRRELRRQADMAELKTPSAAPEPAAAGKEGKATATAKPKKPRKKKAPPRICARWAIFDGSMKQVAVFDYKQRAEADRKMADLSAKKAGGYFLQLVKEPMAEAAE